MVAKLLSKVFGSRNDRMVKKMRKQVEQINVLEPDMQALSDDQLKQKTEELKQRYSDGASLDDLMFEAFAVAREASHRVLGMRHFDTQLIGAMVLHQGKISEMKTGEGKTLMATLAAYLNALSGKGVHVVTVNDYLAKRDSAWMGQLYSYLGLSVGVILSQLPPEERQKAYAADITYGTNNEFGFDYLRDNMSFTADQRFQRGHNFAIIDEVDSILIDEARTPLIISGQAEDSSDMYMKINEIIPLLTRQEEMPGEDGEPEYGPGDYNVDEKAKQVFLSEEDHEKVEDMLVTKEILGEGESLYDTNNIMLMHHVNAALRAHALFQKNVDYIVKNDDIIIVDEFTGRTMPGRRWSEGLHQAVEVKEGLQPKPENQTLASTTFQNYFRLYDKLSGMTGTADTEAFEFQQIYGLETVVIPTNMPMIRKDEGDLVYLTTQEKYQAIAEDIIDCVERQQPVLVGTASIESSELLSQLLDKKNIKHSVLNAKQHEREALIVAEAGLPGSVTIATNMAGRGTDIVLGGNLQVEIDQLGDDVSELKRAELTKAWEQRQKVVMAAGGLRLIGTERNESRRVDNQLRGRSGRQGDPGSSRFYLSLEDNLMRIFASEKVSNLMQKMGMDEGESIEHPWVTKAIENAQRKVEGRNFDIRKQLLEYDDVANDQRKAVYQQRNELIETDDISNSIKSIRQEVVDSVISSHIVPGSLEEQWDVAGLEQTLEEDFATKMPIQEWLDADNDLHEENLRQKILKILEDDFSEKEGQADPAGIRHFEKSVMLEVLDALWKEHLAAMDYLRQGIHLRGYAQKDPKQEYKREAFEMFSTMLDNLKHEVIKVVSRLHIRTPEEMEAERQAAAAQDFQFKHEEFEGFGDNPNEGESDNQVEDLNKTDPFVRDGKKVGRNEPCPCGSGKKYKQCHGKIS